MTRRQRIYAYGSAGAVVVLGAICAIVVPGLAGEVAGWTLLTLGLGAILLLVFYEIGLSEDRELAKEEEQRRRERQRPRLSPRPPPRSRRSNGASRSGPHA
jgi:hypothetical protein